MEGGIQHLSEIFYENREVIPFSVGDFDSNLVRFVKFGFKLAELRSFPEVTVPGPKNPTLVGLRSKKSCSIEISP